MPAGDRGGELEARRRLNREQIGTGLAILVLIGFVSWGAWHDFSAPHAPKEQQRGEGPSATDDHKTAPKPHAAHPERATHEETTDSRDSDSGYSLTNIIQAASAAVSAVFAVAIWCVYRAQARIMRGQLRAGLRAARGAQKSADTSARALADFERPWLFSEGVTITARREPPYENNWFIQFHFKNVGRMPAIVEACAVKFGERALLPPMPDYSNEAAIDISRTFAVGESAVTRAMGPALLGHSREMVAYGRLTYVELNGKRHSTGFAYAVSPMFPASAIYASDAYSYYH
jgi:hypothetical protein